MIEKVISGGQDGVDIAGVRAAKRCGIATGGFIPRGFRTESGDKPEYREEFGMVELPTREYVARTRANAQAADITLLIGEYLASPGSRATIREVNAAKKYLVGIEDIGAGKLYDLRDAAKREVLVDVLAADLALDDFRVLNIAGNRNVDEALIEGLFVDIFTRAKEMWQRSFDLGESK